MNEILKLFIKSRAIATYENVLAGKSRTFPKKFWKGENRAGNILKATDWLVKKLNITDARNLTKQDFVNNDLGGMLSKAFAHNPNKAIEFYISNKKKLISDYVVVNLSKALNTLKASLSSRRE